MINIEIKNGRLVIHKRNSEIWKPIIGWEDIYAISNYGYVKNIITNKYIAGDINNFGYHRVTLYNNNFHKRYFRHRLVAMHFIENPNNYKFVNHIDGIKSNNSIYNLEWCDQSYNEKHAFKMGLRKKVNKPFIIEFNDANSKYYIDQCSCANDLNVTQSTISAWLLHKAKPKFIKKIYFVN